jgi:hypothetical protein
LLIGAFVRAFPRSASEIREVVMSGKQTPSPNDQRGVIKNPNNPAYEADRANRVVQGHPDVPPPARPAQPAPGTKQK